MRNFHALSAEQARVGFWAAGALLLVAGVAEIAALAGLRVEAWLIGSGLLLLGIGGFRPLLSLMALGLAELSSRARSEGEDDQS